MINGTNPSVGVFKVGILTLFLRTHTFCLNLTIWMLACWFLSELAWYTPCCVLKSIEIILSEFSWLTVLWLYMEILSYALSKHLIINILTKQWISSKPGFQTQTGVRISPKTAQFTDIRAEWKPLHKHCFWVLNCLQLDGVTSASNVSLSLVANVVNASLALIFLPEIASSTFWAESLAIFILGTCRSKSLSCRMDETADFTTSVALAYIVVNVVHVSGMVYSLAKGGWFFIIGVFPISLPPSIIYGLHMFTKCYQICHPM